MKTLKTIAKGFVYAFLTIYFLVGSIFCFVSIFESQGFMAIFYFVVFLVSLAASLLFAWVIGEFLNDDNEKVVKCKDCTEWDAKECECYHWYGFKENDHCSHGIRKGAE